VGRLAPPRSGLGIGDHAEQRPSIVVRQIDQEFVRVAVTDLALSLDPPKIDPRGGVTPFL